MLTPYLMRANERQQRRGREKSETLFEPCRLKETAAITRCSCGGPQWQIESSVSFHPRPTSAGMVWDDRQEMKNK